MDSEKIVKHKEETVLRESAEDLPAASDELDSETEATDDGEASKDEEGEAVDGD